MHWRRRGAPAATTDSSSATRRWCHSPSRGCASALGPAPSAANDAPTPPATLARWNDDAPVPSGGPAAASVSPSMESICGRNLVHRWPSRYDHSSRVGTSRVHTAAGTDGGWLVHAAGNAAGDDGAGDAAPLPAGVAGAAAGGGAAAVPNMAMAGGMAATTSDAAAAASALASASSEAPNRHFHMMYSACENWRALACSMALLAPTTPPVASVRAHRSDSDAATCASASTTATRTTACDESDACARMASNASHRRSDACGEMAPHSSAASAFRSFVLPVCASMTISGMSSFSTAVVPSLLASAPTCARMIWRSTKLGRRSRLSSVVIMTRRVSGAASAAMAAARMGTTVTRYRVTTAVASTGIASATTRSSAGACAMAMAATGAAVTCRGGGTTATVVAVVASVGAAVVAPPPPPLPPAAAGPRTVVARTRSCFRSSTSLPAASAAADAIDSCSCTARSSPRSFSISESFFASVSAIAWMGAMRVRCMDSRERTAAVELVAAAPAPGPPAAPPAAAPPPAVGPLPPAPLRPPLPAAVSSMVRRAPGSNSRSASSQCGPRSWSVTSSANATADAR